MSKLVNVLLVALIVALAFLVLRANHKGQQLKQEHARLAERYGDLAVIDETQFYVVYAPGENPKRQFHWRIYHPNLPNGFGNRRRKNGRFCNGSYTFTASAGETLAFLNFRVRDGNAELYCSVGGSAGALPFPDEIRDILAAHWDQLDFEILGEHEATVIPATEIVPLLVIKIPESLRDQLPEQKSDAPTANPFFEILVGDRIKLQNLP